MKALRTRMTARNVDEAHRVSTPLELLFDLTFVVAIAQIAAELAHYIADGHGSDAVGPFLMIFFAIWWAWLNFTWFASAYDTDDVLYRLLVLLQMFGVLVIAAGVPAAFEHNDLTQITLGYFIMRAAAVAQWLRAAIEHPESRSTAMRYAAGIAIVQALWVVRALVPGVPWWVFVVLALAEMAIPLIAERRGTTAWHPHHIAERYGLFTIIVLGESVLAATTGVQDALNDQGVTASLVLVSASGLALMFALWWLYFLEPAGDGLAHHRERSYFWGYGHYLIFAALAALGAGLEVAVEGAGHDLERVSQTAISFAVAIPVAVFLFALWAVHAPLVERAVIRPAGVFVSVILVLLIPLAAPIAGVVGCVLAITLVCALLVVAVLADTKARAAVQQAHS